MNNADIRDKSTFEHKLESELKPQEVSSPVSSYSELYNTFKSEQLSATRTFYERACAVAGKFKVKVNQQKQDEINSYSQLAHLNVTPQSVYALAYLSGIALMILSVAGFFIFGLAFTLLGLIFSIIALTLMPRIPKFIFNSWRAKASDQLVLAVLYLVIYMKRDANLENAIYFVAKQLPPPVSLDFMKILWNLETKTFSTVNESLENYVGTWKDRANSFVDAIHLIEASLSSPDKSQSKSLLTKATDVILQGTQDSMIKYAHSLQGPISMIHMLGIVLPILLLIMMPMVGAFLGDVIRPIHLIIGYNIFLPILVYALVSSVIQIRPGGTTVKDVEFFKHATARRSKYLKPAFVGIFILFLIPPILYIANVAPKYDSLQSFYFSTGLLYFSLFVVAGLGLSISFYYKTYIRRIIKQKHKTERLEAAFSAAIFQLGSRLQENAPAEIAFGSVSKATKGTDVGEFFEIVNQNMRQRGMSLRDAIFNNKQGALTYYPSSTIRSVMALLIEGVKKSPQAVAESLITISTYLTDMHRVSERLKDLLAETIASIKMQASFLAAIIAAVVVSLTVLITQVLLQLGKQLGSVDTNVATQGAGLVSFFKVKSAIPPFVFQLIVGVYIVEVVILLSYLLAGVVYGRDNIEIKSEIAKNLLLATSLYVVITLVATLFFSQIANVVLGV